MNLINYTGKLNSHKEYIDVLQKLSKVRIIEIAVINVRNSNKLIYK